MSQNIDDDTLKILAYEIIAVADREAGLLVERTQNLVDYLIDSSHEGYATVDLDDVFRILTGNEEV